MYYLNKIIGWCASPLGGFFLAMLGAWLLRNRFPRVARTLGFAAMAGLWILGSGITTNFLGAPLERVYLHEGCACDEIGEIPDAELIVLLGGGVGTHEKCHAPEMFQSSDRLRQAARLWHRAAEKGRRLRIICTGRGVAHSALPLLEEWGVPRELVEFSDEPRNTAEEARIIRESGVKKIALVTSAWHMRRAVMLFGRQGLDVSPVPGDFEMTCAAEEGVKFHGFFPSADAYMRNSAALKEWVGIAGYSIFR